MIELLALPGWKTAPTKLEDWVGQLETHGGPVVVSRESSDASWLELGRLRLRGYAMHAGPYIEAINFELTESDPGPATIAVRAAAEALGWEVHEDDGEDDGDDGD